MTGVFTDGRLTVLLTKQPVKVCAERTADCERPTVDASSVNHVVFSVLTRALRIVGISSSHCVLSCVFALFSANAVHVCQNICSDGSVR